MPVTKRVSLKKFAEEELKELTKVSLEEQKMIVTDAIVRSIPQIVAISPVDTGLYAQSWSHLVKKDVILVGNSAPHAPIIEHGARPFRPPLAPLLAWAKRVLQDPSQPPHYSPAVQGLARATQNKIERVGMAPRHIMMQGVDIILENIKKSVREPKQ